MPEADSIKVFQKRLKDILLNEKLEQILCRWDSRIKGLSSTSVVAVHSHGKVLWLEFSDETSLVVHLGMKGKWYFLDESKPESEEIAGELANRTFKKSAEKDGLYLVTKKGSATLRFPKVLERVPAHRVYEHRLLRRLGPDLLSDSVDLLEVVKNAREKDEDDKDIAELLLDQEVCAGIGNIFKCETLAAMKIHPWAPGNAFNEARLLDVFSKARSQMLHRLKQKLSALKLSDKAHSEVFQPQVYQRHKEGCRTCGHEVLVEEHGGEFSRLTWWCRFCQTAEK